MFDLVIRNGLVVDGTGAPGFGADVAVRGDEIVTVGRLGEVEAEEVVDAGGRVVAPGFVDLHCHTDGSFLLDPLADSKVRQGVTLELMGNCGMSFCAPLGGMAREYLNDWLDRYGSELEVDWSSMGGYLDALERVGSTVNLAAQVGHGTVRQNVLGMDARAPSADEQAHMERLVAESLDEGALGFSTGLFYTPGSYSVTDEVVGLAQVAAGRGALYSSHLRSEGADGPGMMTAYEEALEIGRRTGVRVEISHVKCKGIPVWGRANDLLELMEKARREGLDVAGDQYPYPRSSTLMTGALFPKWAQEGGRAAVLERISDDDTRAKVRAGIDYNVGLYEGPQAFVFASFAPEPRYEGMHLGEIADELGCEPSEAALRVYERGAAQVVLASLRQDDVDTIAAAPFISVASDGNSLRAEGPLSSGTPHPRSYGTNARFISEYVNKKKGVSLESAVHRMSGLPASRLGLSRRGRIAPAYAADIVVFEPANVEDRATFTHPHQYAVGIDEVWVNGVRAVSGGAGTGVTAGRVLRGRDG